MNGAYKPVSNCKPVWGWNQWVPGLGTTKSYVNSPAIGIDGVVTPGTPSIGFGTAKPCQCTLVSSVRSLGTRR